MRRRGAAPVGSVGTTRKSRVADVQLHRLRGAVHDHAAHAAVFAGRGLMLPKRCTTCRKARTHEQPAGAASRPIAVTVRVKNES